ncbi:sigma factor-like helix-turn-helix DNA-binding protein [Rhodococcus sp. NPDC003348]
MTTSGPARTMIAELPERQRGVLHLRLIRGLSVQRTAEILGSSPTAVLLTQHEALNALRRQLVTPGAPDAGGPPHP